MMLVVMVAGIWPAPAEPSLDPVFAEWRDRVDPAVDRALLFLQRSQQKDGAFPHNYGDSVGVPALVGMAVLSKGYTPMEGPYSEMLNRSLDFPA